MSPNVPRSHNDVSSSACVFVLASPPLTDGTRTLRRVDRARELLGFERSIVVNLFPIATRDVLDISASGKTEESWLAARSQIADALQDAGGVVLAYGVSTPLGAARDHHRIQVDWLLARIAEQHTKTWMVGGRPLHPSRWQRFTYATFPGESFNDALAMSIWEIHSREA